MRHRMSYLVKVRNELVRLHQRSSLSLTPGGERGLESADLHGGTADRVQGRVIRHRHISALCNGQYVRYISSSDAPFYFFAVYRPFVVRT